MSDKLVRLRDAVRRQRDLELQLRDAKSTVERYSQQVYELQHKELPDLFFEAGVNLVGLTPEGNFPGYDAKLSPFYRANIAASWEPDKKQAAFDYLEKIGAGDLIKHVITIRLGKGDMATARKVQAALEKMKVDYSAELNVHPMTLTAWLKEQVESGTMPPLELLGGEVGSVVKLKERK
jgi:hypothetical protein